MRRIVLTIGITVLLIFAGLIALVSAADNKAKQSEPVRVELENGL